ncbi:MAG: 2Fe-2S iron-sulfur cluster binding domain-containing protein [Nitrospiraceae bacterium]|nr:2Fe-2S iron-sulfur cluster binding domain-containing protein [Nitrospiraceae bacterium]
MKDPHRNICVLTLAAILVLGTPATGQIAPGEHAEHHPQPGAANPATGGNAGGGMGGAAMGGNQPAAGGGPGPSRMGPPAGVGPPGGMGRGMDEMMKKMGTPPPKELYPLLMDVPDLPPEQRAEVEQLAHERMKAGAARLSSGVEKLAGATSDDDYSAMQQATEHMRQGLAEFESGLAAHRALSEGQVTRNVALQWFKREMNLASPIPRDELHALLGITPFHLFTMGLLIVFALAMVAIYFFKMRRAAALFGRLDPGSGPPPPGGAPPLAGAPGPSTPPAGGTPPPAAPPSPAVLPAEKSPPLTPPPAAPAAGRPAASAPSREESSAIPVPTASSVPPLTANWRGQLRVGSIVTETPSVKTFRLLPSSNDGLLPFTFVPGQFINVAFGIGGARMNRSYSISSSPTQRDYVELTVRREPRGAVSRHMNDLLKVGDRIEAGGPVGRFTFTGTEADSIVLVSGGVGITPMMSITRYLTERAWAGDIFLIYTCRTPADFIFANEVAALQRRNPKLRVAVTISKAEGTDWKGARGRITKEWLTQTVPDLASRRIHLCGPQAMMDTTKALLAEIGVPPDCVKTELFGATKPTPAAAGTTAKPTAPATGPLVTFSKNNKSAKIHVDLQTGDSPPKQSILELSEELGIGIDFSCRVGTCGLCKVKLTSGEVEMAVEDALDADDKINGIILACQAKPKGEVTVEA